MKCSRLWLGVLSLLWIPVTLAEVVLPVNDWQSIRYITDSPKFSRAISQNTNDDNIVAIHNLLFARMVINPVIEVLPMAKITEVLSAQAPACTFFKLKTPARQSRFIFSLPTDFLLTHHLYTLKHNAPLVSAVLNNNGEVSSLAELFRQNPDKHIILLKDRSYGAELDNQIAALPDSAVYWRWGTNQYNDDVKMLVRERAAFVLTFPASVDHLTAPTGEGNSELVGYRIAGSPLFKSGHIMCNDTPQTQAFISAADNSLRSLYYEPAYRSALLKGKSRQRAATLDQVLGIIQQY